MGERECAGLKVVRNTLAEDRSYDQSWGPSQFEGVSGQLEIEILPVCLLREELMFEIAELMAEEAANDTLPRHVEVEAWKVERKGNLIIVRDNGSCEVDPDLHLRVARKETYTGRYAK